MARLKKINWVRVSCFLFVAAIVGLVTWYVITIRSQLAFAVVHPRAVSVCMEGYMGEHNEADKRFETKQRSEAVISPLVEEAKKE